MGWGGVGWGGGGVGWGGVGWGGVGIIPNVSPATLHDLQWHLMVRVGWGGDNAKRVWRYAA